MLNIEISDYVKLVCGSIFVASKFTSYKEGFGKDMVYRTTIRKIFELVEDGREL